MANTDELSEALRRLQMRFPLSFINHNNELILLPRKNIYIELSSIKTFEDLCCYIVNYLSREIANSSWYAKNISNLRYQKDMQEKIENSIGIFLQKEDWELIYKYLGNGINKDLTKRFVENEFDMDYLREQLKGELS